MPRHQTRAAQRARRAQKNTGGKRKYTALLRESSAPRFVRKEPVHAEAARRLALHLRTAEGDMGDRAARLVDDALAWALKQRELSWALRETPDTDTIARARACDALSTHLADEVTVHDAPLVRVVYEVLEMAADQQAPWELLRAAADVLDKLVGQSNHICNPAINGVRADGWLTAPRMWEWVYTCTDPAAALAAAALRTLRDAAGIPEMDELTDADCWFTLQEAVRFAVAAADLAARAVT